MVWSAFSNLIRGHAGRYTFFITESTLKPSLPENEVDLNLAIRSFLFATYSTIMAVKS